MNIMNTAQKLGSWGKKNFGKLKNLADALNIKQESLSAYVNGRRDPGAPFLRKLQELGCDINWLLKEETNNLTSKPHVSYQADEMERLRAENKELKYKLNQIHKIINQNEASSHNSENGPVLK